MNINTLFCLPYMTKVSELIGEITEEECKIIADEIELGFDVPNIASAILQRRTLRQNLTNTLKIFN